MSQLEGCIRKELDESAPRLMAILDPIRLILTNLSEVRELSLKMHPKLPGQRTVTVESDLWMDRSDFRVVDDANYYGLAPNKEVVLKYFAVVRCESYDLDVDG